MDEKPGAAENQSRRRVLKVIAVGGAGALTVMLPSKWTQPLIESIVVPAHAAASPTSTTTTTTTALPPPPPPPPPPTSS